MTQRAKRALAALAISIAGFIIMGIFVNWWLVLGIFLVLWGNNIQMDNTNGVITPEQYNKMTTDIQKIRNKK